MDITLPKLPKQAIHSPEVVIVLDKIRFELEKEGEKYYEFCWFAREYPRYYRFHFDQIEYRLNHIYYLYKLKKKQLESETMIGNETYPQFPFERTISDQEIKLIYWEFEAFLNSMSTSLDLLSRIVGTAYRNQTPPSLSKLIKNKDLKGLVDILREAKAEWIDEMKDYRDCFTHYTPVDSMLYIALYSTRKQWKIICKIPKNPNVREAEGFQFGNSFDVLRFAIKYMKKLVELDKRIGREIKVLYDNKQFPVRISNLFYLGKRE